MDPENDPESNPEINVTFRNIFLYGNVLPIYNRREFIRDTYPYPGSPRSDWNAGWVCMGAGGD